MREFTTGPDGISRRAFLAALAAAPLAPPRSPVVDTHMHVWTNDVEHFPFAHPYDPNFKPPPVAGSVEMLLEEMDHSAIDYAVLVQVIYYGWDNRLCRPLCQTPSAALSRAGVDRSDRSRS